MSIDKNLIPKGKYCYFNAKLADGAIKKCPYWELKSSINGYCDYVKISDEDTVSDTLLYDYIKTCNINL